MFPQPSYGCGQNALDTTNRQAILSRGDDPKIEDEVRPPQSQTKPVTLPISSVNPQRTYTNAQAQTPHTTPTPMMYYKPMTDAQAHAQASIGPSGQTHRSNLTNTGFGGNRAHSPGIPSQAHIPGPVPMSTAESGMIVGGAMYPSASQYDGVSQSVSGYQPVGPVTYTSSSQPGGSSIPSAYAYRHQPSQHYMDHQFSARGIPGRPVTLPPTGHPTAMTPGHPSGMPPSGPPSGGTNTQQAQNRRHSPPNYGDPRYYQQGGPHQY